MCVIDSSKVGKTSKNKKAKSRPGDTPSVGDMVNGGIDKEDMAANSSNQGETLQGTGHKPAAVETSGNAPTRSLPYPSSIFMSEETNEGKSARSVWTEEEDKVVGFSNS